MDKKFDEILHKEKYVNWKYTKGEGSNTTSYQGIKN